MLINNLCAALCLALLAGAQDTNHVVLSPTEQAALRARRVGVGLPMPPHATTERLASTVRVEDAWATQTFAVVTVTIVTSNELAYVMVHRGSNWVKKYLPSEPATIISVSTNKFDSLTNAPEVKP